MPAKLKMLLYQDYNYIIRGKFRKPSLLSSNSTIAWKYGIGITEGKPTTDLRNKAHLRLQAVLWWGFHVCERPKSRNCGLLADGPNPCNGKPSWNATIISQVAQNRSIVFLLDKRNCCSWWSPTDIQVVTFPISTLDSSGVLRVPLTADFLNIINGVL
jgi:hypothetical protein